MTTPAELAADFTGVAVPPELVKLLAFQNDKSGFERYCQGFGLTRDDKGGLRSWSADAEFLARLHPFAQASGGGSFYASWSTGGGDAGAFPVIAFGDEGGVHVVAADVRGLLQILAFDTEPMIDHDGVTYYKAAGTKASKDHAGYVAWLGELGLSADADPTAIVAAAQAKHKAAFAAWFAGFVG